MHTVDGQPPGPEAGAARPGGRLLPGVGLVLLLLAAVFGANLRGVRDRVLGTAVPPARPAATGRVAGGPGTSTPAGLAALHSQPWWQTVTTSDGAGGTSLLRFTIADEALEWRVKWTCTGGRLVIPSPSRPKPLVDSDCPARGTAVATATGPASLRVQAGGPFQLVVDQHVDVPLVEPPLPAMSQAGAAAVATGSFYRIDEAGTGKATMYRLADGSHALRLEDFFVTANVGLELRLSPVVAPHTTKEYTAGPSAFVAPLDVTAGSFNVVVPEEVDVAKYRSLVVWCPTVNSAYAAVTLPEVAAKLR